MTEREREPRDEARPKAQNRSSSEGVKVERIGRDDLRSRKDRLGEGRIDPTTLEDRR